MFRSILPLMSDQIRRDPAFQNTSWTLVRNASDSERETLARRAIGTFCADYWYPIYAFVRRKGYSKEEAEDQTQEFFGRLASEQLLAKAEPSEIRLRTFLLRIMQQQLKNEREKVAAKKRGGGMQKLSLDFQTAEGRYVLEPEDPGMTPEALFDRTWALATLDRCLERLAASWEAKGKADEFTALRPFLSLTDAGTASAKQVATQLVISEDSARQKIKRLRTALGNALRDQVASSLADEASETVAEEISNLRAALG